MTTGRNHLQDLGEVVVLLEVVFKVGYPAVGVLAQCDIGPLHKCNQLQTDLLTMLV